MSRGAARRRAGAGGGAREAVASGARVVALRALAMWAGGPQSRPRVRGGGDRARVRVRVLAHGVPSDGGVCACVARCSAWLLVFAEAPAAAAAKAPAADKAAAGKDKPAAKG